MRAELLNAVVVKGVAETGALADAIDVPEAEAGPVLAELAEKGLIRYRSGRLGGWMATEPGREERARLMRAQRLVLPDDRAYSVFVVANAELKRQCLSWQTADAPELAQYVEELAVIHAQVHQVIGVFQRVRPRFAAYARRLDATRERFLAGDPHALTGVGADSYHTVWMELHSDILATLDRPRNTIDGA